MTGAVVRTAGGIPVISASDSPFSHLSRSLLLFIEFLIASQSRQFKYFNVYCAVVTAVLGLGTRHDFNVATLFFVNR